jgi:hypothetical protein
VILLLFRGRAHKFREMGIQRFMNSPNIGTVNASFIVISGVRGLVRQGDRVL